MELYEVPYLIKALSRKGRPDWERARYISLIVANSMGAKIKVNDLSFPWENETVQEVPDIKAMREELNKLKSKK